jgi:hypothetical protein
MGSTKTLSPVAVSTKQKVVAGVVAVAIVASALGIVSAIGSSRGYSFGWPFISKSKIIGKTSTRPKTPPVQKAPLKTIVPKDKNQIVVPKK